MVLNLSSLRVGTLLQFLLRECMTTEIYYEFRNTFERTPHLISIIFTTEECI